MLNGYLEYMNKEEWFWCQNNQLNLSLSFGARAVSINFICKYVLFYYILLKRIQFIQ